MTSSAFTAATPDTVVLSREILDACAAVKGHAPLTDDQLAGAPIVEICPVSASVVQTEHRRQEERQAAAREALKAQIGKQVGDKGILVGQRTILGNTFNLYAAPQDLSDRELKYSGDNGAVATVGRLMDSNGHNGLAGGTYDAFVQALQNSTYDGEWFIPPSEWMTQMPGTQPQGDTLKNISAAFNKNATYGSSSEPDGKTSFTTAVQFPSGTLTRKHVSMDSARYRLVRVELA